MEIGVGYRIVDSRSLDAAIRQRESIEQWAAENGVRIVAWVDDLEALTTTTADPRARPGFCRVLRDALAGRYQRIVVAHVGLIERRWPYLRQLLAYLHDRGVRIDAAIETWGCLAQQARWFYRLRRTGKASS